MLALRTGNNWRVAVPFSPAACAARLDAGAADARGAALPPSLAGAGVSSVRVRRANRRDPTRYRVNLTERELRWGANWGLTCEVNVLPAPDGAPERSELRLALGVARAAERSLPVTAVLVAGVAAGYGIAWWGALLMGGLSLAVGLGMASLQSGVVADRFGPGVAELLGTALAPGAGTAGMRLAGDRPAA